MEIPHSEDEDEDEDDWDKTFKNHYYCAMARGRDPGGWATLLFFMGPSPGGRRSEDCDLCDFLELCPGG
jgi:hypothetical protein